MYFDKPFIERPGLSSKFFPDSQGNNVLICVSPSPDDGVAVLLANYIANLHFNGDTQCSPLYYYEERSQNTLELFDTGGGDKYIRKDGVSDFILQRVQKQYGTHTTGKGAIGKEDIFYYVYGILHSPYYRLAFASDLKKMLPRIPLVDEVSYFWKFSKAGRDLAHLHLNYESQPHYAGIQVSGADSGFYQVDRMRFPKKDQKDTIIYNSKIVVSNIPARAYEYVVNGKSAIEWIMERYQLATHKESGIQNDPNDWAEETGNPRYVLDLLLSIINLSIQTTIIVGELPIISFAD